MKYLKFALFFTAAFLTLEGMAQSTESNADAKNSFIIKIDSLEIDIYNNYESDNPPITLNNLKEPSLFILNDKELKISKFSELNLEKEKIQTLIIIQDPIEIKKMGNSSINSIVKIKTKEFEEQDRK